MPSIDQPAFVNHALADSVGRVFHSGGRVYRAILPDAAGDVRRMFDSGMLDALAEAGLFPRSAVTDLMLEGYAMVVEHAPITPPVYPYEWSFGMLRDAALAVLRLNRIARGFGYQTMDCHGFNVMFDGVTPKFVDLGSFRPASPTGQWLAHDEFLRYYLYPLMLWAEGSPFLARQTLLNDVDMLPHAEFILCRLPLLRRLPARMRGLAARAYLRWQRARLSSLEALEARVGRLRRAGDGRWSAYHAAYFGQSGRVAAGARYERVIELINSRGGEIRSTVEVGGNAGALSDLIRRRTAVERAICTDYDEGAIDALYTRQLGAAEGGRAVVPMVLNFLYPISGGEGAPVAERIRSDAVIALALLHHIVLGQRVRIDYALDMIGRYSRRFALVEFMPLGLWDGSRPADVPAWYTAEWFEAAFTRRFRLISKDELEPNRVLYFGEHLNPPGEG